VHDYFDLLGLSTRARASEIRRRSASRPRRWHPDFGGGSLASRLDPVAPPRSDAAVDFVNITHVIDRMQHAFFREAPPAR
jgi:hypothetical protein